MRLSARAVVPLLGAIPLAGAIAGASYALQASLNRPPAGSTLATALVTNLERLKEMRTLEIVPGLGALQTTCSTRHHMDHLLVGNGTRVLIRGTHVVRSTGPPESASRLSVEADLAGCPGFLADDLSGRLMLGKPAFRRGTRDGLIFRIHGPAPLIELTVARHTLRPLRIHVLSDRIAAYAEVDTHRELPPSTPAQFLALAESGLARTLHVFWNPKLHWYDERVSKRWKPTAPLAHLWAAFPLFEALDTVAIADPTRANRAAVTAFARGAERYFNAALKPVGGFAYYPGTTNPREHTFFDDNGWWELAYLDAYRATRNPRDLRDAERAFRFIAVSGWDHSSGGTWWETLHEHKTSEPLAAEIYAGFALYRASGVRSYLSTAETFLTWADRHSWNSAKQLYQRNATDPTVLDYVEGMMIGAQLELCQIRGVHGPCTKAEQLARASVAAFPRYADWTPAADVVYLRFLLDLYREDGSPAWYRLVYGDAQRASRLARSEDGLYFKRWDGGKFPAKLLQPNAATLGLFALIGETTPPPAPR
jgi:Glycosyl hydrolase family 76